MNARVFFNLVAAMRDAQKAYFKTRSRSALQKSRSIESKIDMEIKRVQDIIRQKEGACETGDLFDRRDI